MGYRSDKELQADYLEILRKTRRCELEAHQQTSRRNNAARIVVVVLVILLASYLAMHHR